MKSPGRISLVVSTAGILLASAFSAAVSVNFGRLSVESVGANSCPYGDSFRQGEQVRLRGSGYASGSQVDLEIWAAGDFHAGLGSTNANGSGEIDVVVTIPLGIPAPTVAKLEANGVAPAGGRALDKMIDIGPSAAGDDDGDGVPDFCDNCPALSNPGQEDDDKDGKGNACDACPMDSGNDEDGDGLCGDADACPFDADNDVDGDGVCGDEDNCPTTFNPNQADDDVNGIGDACQQDPTCSDGIDNDGDRLVDHPSDPGCASPSDTSETDPSLPCDDGLDNDADAHTDFRPNGVGDPGCETSTSPTESPECNDQVDNDGDGAVDWDGNHSLFEPDPECGGLAYHDSETVPEPGVPLGLAAGVGLLAAMGRRRRGRAAGEP